MRFNQYNFLYLSYTSCLVQAWLGDLSLMLISCYTTVTPFPSHAALDLVASSYLLFSFIKP